MEGGVLQDGGRDDHVYRERGGGNEVSSCRGRPGKSCIYKMRREEKDLPQSTREEEENYL